MVRFQWLVEEGYTCHTPLEKVVYNQEHGVIFVTMEFEIPGQSGPVEALITVPPTYQDESKMKDVGVALGHGMNAAEWKGKLMTDISVALAKQGYVVLRYFCKQKEQRRQRLFEKALDACATSPLARCVTRWVLAGIGNGARVAAAVGMRCRRSIAGFVFMSYPLNEPMPSNKGAPAPDSAGPLVKLAAPLLFITASHDKFCKVEDLKGLSEKMPSSDMRLMVLQDHDQNFRTLSGKGPLSSAISMLCSATLEFVNAIQNNALDLCTLPQLVPRVEAQLPVAFTSPPMPLSIGYLAQGMPTSTVSVPMVVSEAPVLSPALKDVPQAPKTMPSRPLLAPDVHQWDGSSFISATGGPASQELPPLLAPNERRLVMPTPLSLEVRGVGASSMPGSSAIRPVLHLPLGNPSQMQSDGLVGSMVPLGVWEGGVLPHAAQRMGPHGGPPVVEQHAGAPMSMPYSAPHL
ncbi:unnamed protein product [Ostreobium quekettii]|uniref:KANL3/Tex30 alpha/beta hydrolase-like domain-containing protein n=1 Tax=Ostreobium quekettii TaxID=121088 RepID=A0A8S1J2X9_9CHLO|nr:unnamed protein product [Ostreobium quekettii]|eukprot:evm.model.scf_765.1 EVM.evm.TU.scf_765.1   scf_765:8292-12734(-)